MRGGVGARGGPGEQQIETERRRIRKRIRDLDREIEQVRGQRHQQRTGRRRAELQTAAIVGYTNAGKSTLLNALTGASVRAEHKLFATLDPTTRRLDLPTGRQVLLTDTVGFIQKLPTDLVAAFRATLEEVTEADIVVQVLDASSPVVEEQATTVEKELAELGADDKPPPVSRPTAPRPLPLLPLAEHPDHAADDADQADVAGDDRLVGRVLGDELDVAVAALEALDGGVVVDQGDDDRAVGRLLLRLHEHEVAVEDAGVDHAVAAHAEQEVAVLGQLGREEHVVLD